MPGRRKRRRSRKKSLVFTESPINNQKQLPTPVHCVDNPVTAKIVPVEEDSLWVSPQFRDILSSKREARYVRRCHSTIVTRTRNPSNKENTTLHHKSQYRNKYKSLKFLGDNSFIESEEDISFSSPSPISNRVHGVVNNKSLHKTPESNGQGMSWSLEKLKRSKKAFDISFSESLNVSTPTMPHMNHTLNIPVDTQTQDVTCVDIPHQDMVTPKKSEKVPRNNKDVLDDTFTPRRRSTRLKAKYLQAFELFRTPPPERPNYGKILVKDTPECDYNLSVRARQLREIQTKIVGYIYYIIYNRLPDCMMKTCNVIYG
ncbi:hypothetical protein LOTGIDRAFT_232030 [Lottia gigantea]|uniref:Uncharacterized protein n=1 Tax=Lottia gigantea TaxID=225164 RepID=V3ZV23_LOTGI|nr:hypothetical protein LOTGIDRAFT_232030 [Lottia gigantea]ESO95328.1 hypothetical protein LOTGIDRAFT_232030 [Lottia gigantea]